MADVLELDEVAKRFGDLQVLENVNLKLSAGESVAILGPSGSGKSTLLHIAGLMEAPSGGQVLLNDENVSKLTDKRRAHARLNTIGFLFQFHYLLPEFNVLENVLIPSRLAGDDLIRAEKDAKRLLARLGLSERLHHKPQELSGGEQQRTALARAMIRKPRLLLCDEPTGNLDSATARDVMNVIWNQIQEEQLSTILVTHNESLAKLADVSYHLSDGRLIKKPVSSKRSTGI